MDRRSSQQSEGSVGSGSEYSGFKYNHHNKKGEDKPLPPAVLVYHESARSIVFRDHVRRVSIDDKRYTQKDSDEPNVNADCSNVSLGSSSMIQEEHNKPSTSTATPTQVIIANYTPVIEPLAALEVMPGDDFTLLRESNPFTSEGELNEQVWENMSVAEKEVVTSLKQERAVVKTIKNADWTSFLKKFQPTDDKIQHEAHPSGHNHHQSEQINNTHRDESGFSFHSFVTSTTLLPPCGKKMRCYGSVREYNVGVVFAIPDHTDDKEEDEKAKLTKTWSWPSGYSAKTEFNIGHNGRLINGREEALVPLSGLRKMNHDYCHKTDFEICGRMVKGGLKTVPYNEVYIRVGGVGRIVNGIDVATNQKQLDKDDTGRSFSHGIGLPIALFIRTTSYNDLIALLRTRARVATILGKKHTVGIPLLFIHQDFGVRVLTDSLQKKLLHVMASSLNPFQNPLLQHKTGIDSTSELHLQQKLEELIDLDDDNIRETLTPEECARLAGGFGATDDSLANLLMDVMLSDETEDKNTKKSAMSGDDDGNISNSTEHGMLQDLVNEGLTSAVRSGDYNTARQLLILYTLVASRSQQYDQNNSEGQDEDSDKVKKASTSDDNTDESNLIILKKVEENSLSTHNVPPPPPPPPLDTDRLRSATNSDGLLSVLGAAEVLKSMQDGSAKQRVEEAVSAIDEWIESGEHSVAFRLASWRDQKAAQGDLQIATEHDTNFLAFISNKAISNRKNFALQLRKSIPVMNFEDLGFLKAIHEIVSNMHSPCLRLELLQYILGLDNRYSVAHVARSIELAATCLNISANDVFEKK